MHHLIPVDTCTYPAKSGNHGHDGAAPRGQDRDDERRKLDLVVSVAGQVWG
jgi:hypothetical protein